VSITSMSGRSVTVYRRTAFVIDAQALAAAAASITPDRQPAAAGLVELEVTGTGPFGTLDVVGLVGGVPDNELLTFTGAGTQVTTKRFDASGLTSIDRAGWSAAASFSARSVGGDGSRLHIAYSVVSAWPMHLNRGAARWPNTTAGVAEVERTWFGVDYTTVWAPRDGDVFVDDDSGEQWKVVGTPDWLGGRRPHHWEVRVERQRGALGT
jgi:hypothetical protein